MPGPFSRSNIFMIRQICIRRCQIASIYPHPFPADQGQPILRLIDSKGIRWSTVDVDLVPFHSEVANPSYQSHRKPRPANRAIPGRFHDLHCVEPVAWKSALTSRHPQRTTHPARLRARTESDPVPRHRDPARSRRSQDPDDGWRGRRSNLRPKRRRHVSSLLTRTRPYRSPRSAGPAYVSDTYALPSMATAPASEVPQQITTPWPQHAAPC